MTIIQIPIGPLQTNCYILGCEETGKAAVIDPAWDGRFLAQTLRDQKLTLTHILITHSHFDHVGGLAELKEAAGVPVYIHPEAVDMLAYAAASAARWQIDMPQPPPADLMLTPGETLRVGQLKLDVLFTPGHAPGHVSFYLADEGVVFDGDTLFRQSIGRTDLPGGDMSLLMQSIRRQLLTLPDDTRVLSGHGEATTIGYEKAHNPFLNTDWGLKIKD